AWSRGALSKSGAQKPLRSAWAAAGVAPSSSAAVSAVRRRMDSIVSGAEGRQPDRLALRIRRQAQANVRLAVARGPAFDRDAVPGHQAGAGPSAPLQHRWPIGFDSPILIHAGSVGSVLHDHAV